MQIFSSINICMERPDKLPDTFCTAPWVHAYYDSTGQRFPCSIVHMHGTSNRERWNVQRPINEWINCDLQKDMRRDMLKGKMLNECNNCNINFEEQRRVEKVYKDYWNDNYIDFVNKVNNLTNAIVVENFLLLEPSNNSLNIERLGIFNVLVFSLL